LLPGLRLDPKLNLGQGREEKGREMKVEPQAKILATALQKGAIMHLAILFQ